METLIEVISTIFTPYGLMLLLIGTVVAMIMGMLPGLSGTEAMILLLPFTYKMPLAPSMLLLVSAYAGSYVGAAITSIIFGIPGSSTSLATPLDGYPMRKQGRGMVAIGAATAASCLGGLLSVFIVIALFPLLVPLGLLFGPPEWLAFVAFGLFVVALQQKEYFCRALISGFLGLIVGSIGFNSVTGALRFTFGSSYLRGGINIIVAFIALYPLVEAVSMTLEDIQSYTDADSDETLKSSKGFRDLLEGIKLTFKYYPSMLIGLITGWVIGVIPGVGATLSNVLSYNIAKFVSKNPETFGKGDIRGVIAAETGNNACVGGAMIPTLALGIPGSLNSAILLGMFLLNGVPAGTNIFANNVDIAWMIILAAIFSTILSSIISLIVGWRLGQLLYELEIRLTVPVIVFIAAIAAYLIQSEIADVLLAFFLAFIGYGMKKYHFSRLNFLIALMLAPIFEGSYFQSIQIGRGSHLIFVNRPITLLIWFLMIALGIFVFTKFKKS